MITLILICKIVICALALVGLITIIGVICIDSGNNLASDEALKNLTVAVKKIKEGNDKYIMFSSDFLGFENVKPVLKDIFKPDTPVIIILDKNYDHEEKEAVTDKIDKLITEIRS